MGTSLYTVQFIIKRKKVLILETTECHISVWKVTCIMIKRDAWIGILNTSSQAASANFSIGNEPILSIGNRDFLTIIAS